MSPFICNSIDLLGRAGTCFKQLRCDCKHNTCGESCNECCPLFNQLPWKAGNNQNPHICQRTHSLPAYTKGVANVMGGTIAACQCFNHADECVYDEDVAAAGSSMTPEGVYEGGGRCVDCRDRTTGVNCEECLPKHFRPAGTSHYSRDACQPCDCDAEGSVDGSCVRDETTAAAGQTPGDCLCKPGFGGRRCERCAEGFRNYPDCEPCPCNKAGSSNFATCEDVCVCKANVEGEFCDRCKAGFINLAEDNAAGCQPCFCFGLSDQCRSVDWPLGRIHTLSGWNLTDQYGQVDVAPVTAGSNSVSSLVFNTRQQSRHGLYLWKAPPAYTGNMVSCTSSRLPLVSPGLEPWFS